MRGRLHEVYADEAGAAGFAALLAVGLAATKPVVWLQEKRAVQGCGSIQGFGLAGLGLNPRDWLFVRSRDGKAMLQACLDAVRCPGLGAVVFQAQGRLPELDLTASRRLTLAAERSGVTVLVVRTEAEPVPSAAETRWAVAPAPSRALAANAPGVPAFDLELLRQRAGPSGLSWRVEWDRDRRSFREAEIPGAMVPVPVRRPAADPGTGPLPVIRRNAA